MNWSTLLGPAVGVLGLIAATIFFLKNRKLERLKREVVVDDLVMMPSRTGDWEELAPN